MFSLQDTGVNRSACFMYKAANLSTGNWRNLSIDVFNKQLLPLFAHTQLGITCGNSVCKSLLHSWGWSARFNACFQTAYGLLYNIQDSRIRRQFPQVNVFSWLHRLSMCRCAMEIQILIIIFVQVVNCAFEKLGKWFSGHSAHFNCMMMYQTRIGDTVRQMAIFKLLSLQTWR